MGSRPALAAAQRRARPPGRPARPPGPLRGGRAAARRPRRATSTRLARSPPSTWREGDTALAATSSSGPWTRSTRTSTAAAPLLGAAGRRAPRRRPARRGRAGRPTRWRRARPVTTSHYLDGRGRPGPRPGLSRRRHRRSAGVPARGARRFARAQMPIEVAHSRLELANAAARRAPRGGDGRGPSSPSTRSTRLAGGTPRRRRGRGAAHAGRALHDGAGKGAGLADQAGGRGARAARPRPVEPARSPTASSSVARRSSTTSATSSPSSACAAGRGRRLRHPDQTSRRIGDLPDAPRPVAGASCGHRRPEDHHHG